jgi:hypothetical protein
VREMQDAPAPAPLAPALPLPGVPGASR